MEVLEKEKTSKLLIIFYILGALFFTVGILFKYVLNTLNISVLLEYIAFSIGYIFIAYDVFIDCIEEWKEKEIFNESLLMIIASIAAIIIREEIEAYLLIILSIIGEHLEHIARRRTESSILDMINLTVDEVTLENGEVIETKDAKIGDIIIVKAGEIVPLDGIVFKGNSYLDTKKMTGETMPQEASVGSMVISGSINQTGVLYIKVTNEYENSASNKLLNLVKEAKEKKSKAESFISKFASIYTPTVILLSIAIFFIQKFLVGNDINSSVYNAATILVISCPCSLVISVPLSFYTGLGKCSSEGILVRGSEYLEEASKINTLIFDKTGTLTEGNFSVTNIELFDIDKEISMSIIYKMEQLSTHPISSVLVDYSRDYSKDIELNNIKEIPGLGLYSRYDNKEVYLGGKNTLKHLNIESNIDEYSTVYLIIDNVIKTKVFLKDTLRDETKSSIDFFKSRNIKSYMLTGDNHKVAEEISRELSLDGYKAELLPDQKLSYLKEYISLNKKGCLAYIGDGMNDAPSLKLADIGIAMGPSSSEAAKEAADIVILKDDISKVKELYQISKYTHKIAVFNIAFALLIKLISILLISFGLLSFLGAYILVVGLFADTGVSLLCILNSTRIRKHKYN